MEDLFKTIEEVPTYTFKILDKVHEVTNFKINVDDSEETQKKIDDRCKKLLTDLDSWDIKNICIEDLIIRNEGEFKVIQQFRKLKDLSNEILTKRILDDILINESSIFDKRNKNKDPTDKIIEIAKIDEVVKKEQKKEKKKFSLRKII